MTTTKKQTAGNNPFLRKVKRVFNAKIYRKALDACNLTGEDAARAYVQTFVRVPVEPHMDALIIEMDARKAAE
jgi:hypothetical protein